jgi:hypothetical protein
MFLMSSQVKKSSQCVTWIEGGEEAKEARKSLG